MGISQTLLLVIYANIKVPTELKDYLLKSICIAAGVWSFHFTSRVLWTHRPRDVYCQHESFPSNVLWIYSCSLKNSQDLIAVLQGARMPFKSHIMIFLKTFLLNAPLCLLFLVATLLFQMYILLWQALLFLEGLCFPFVGFIQQFKICKKSEIPQKFVSGKSHYPN